MPRSPVSKGTPKRSTTTFEKLKFQEQSNSIEADIMTLEKAILANARRALIDDDGAGGVLERRVKFPVWFEPTSSGGRPMCAGLTRGAEAFAQWCDTHPNGGVSRDV
jgi:hypothetical protein